MAYSNYTLESVVEQFDLNIFLDFEKELEKIKELSIVSESFIERLDDDLDLALAINTEKARSELIVMPLLVELRKFRKKEISLFSGVEFSVDYNAGLNGICDFILSLSDNQLFVTAPIINLVEAKKDDVKNGLGQCIAEMVAAQIFNQKKGKVIKNIFGVVTTGSQWKFLKLVEKQIHIQSDEYYIENPNKILSILNYFIETAKVKN